MLSKNHRQGGKKEGERKKSGEGTGPEEWQRILRALVVRRGAGENMKQGIARISIKGRGEKAQVGKKLVLKHQGGLEDDQHAEQKTQGARKAALGGPLSTDP